MSLNDTNVWNPEKNTILIVTKAKDNRLVLFTRQLAEWLIYTPRFGREHPFVVYVDGHLKNSKILDYDKQVESNSVWKSHLKFWTPKLCYKQPELFHLIITLGGDGTILFTSYLFQSKMPPIMPFNLGSLGFLTPFLFTKYKEELDKLFSGKLKSTNRMRLSCTIYRYRKDPYCLTKPRTNKDSTNSEAIVWRNTIPSNTQSSQNNTNNEEWALMETASMRKAFKKAAHGNSPGYIDFLDDNVICYSTAPEETLHVLNEIVIDRGPNSNISMLELFADERHLTTVQADGLCIATATGSTAYSLSANGSLTHPDMHCTLVTPISPHTLSFRPMLLPSNIFIRVVVPFGARNTSFCSFDGRNIIELKHGDHIKITESPYSVKTYCSSDSSNDWFSSVQTSLQWNMHKKQKSLVVVEEDQKDDDTRDKPKSIYSDSGYRKHEQAKLNEESITTSKDAYELAPWTAEEMKRDGLPEAKSVNKSKI